MEKKIVYFEKTGKENTAACLQIVRQAVGDYGYKHIVVATTGGDTGLLFSGQLKSLNLNLVVVTHSEGFKEPNSSELAENIREQILNNGARIYTGTILTHSIETAIASRFNGSYPTQIVALALRRFGEGPKVCCEIIMMAADAGLIPEGEEVLAVAGTGKGADTVLLVKSAASKRFFELKVLEILAKPRVF